MKSSVTILFLLLSFLSHGQVTVAWSNDPGGVALATNQLHNVFSAAWDYNPAGDISLTKRNALGNVFWTVTYDNTDNTRHEVVTWIETDSQNNCLVAGTIRSGYSNPVNAGSILGKYDPSGVLIWSHTNVMAGNKVEIGTDNNPILSGFPNSGTAGAAFMKYDSSGTVLWQNLNADGSEILLLDGQLRLDNSNNAYLSAGNLFNMAVCKINSDGTYGWVGLVSGSNSASSFVRDTDNSIYIIGTTTAKLAETALQVNTPTKNHFTVTPNPFDNYFTIKTLNNVGEKKVTLFSINGMKVYESTFFGESKNIDLVNIDSGLYILNITSQDGVLFNQKIIKK